MTAIGLIRGIRRWGAGLACLFLSGTDVLATLPHYVFAHYMVCYATYGDYWPDTNSTIAGYKRDIQEAQAAGIDGFALNLGAYDDPTQPYYNRRVAMIYEAAEQLGTGFKLFFSIDFNGTNEIIDAVQTYAQRTNTFRQGGNVVLSTYTGNWLPWPYIRSQLSTNGVNTFFIPYILSIPVHEIPTYADGVSILSTNRWGNYLDGLFVWVAAGTPSQLAQCDVGYNQACIEAGKPFMASFAPTYWGCVQTTLQRRYYETQGGEGTALQWMSIITNQPDWVEICTWNDFNESTYISPVDNPGQYFSNIQTPYRYSHAGYLELSKYYIQWFKSGQQPPISQDALFYFYRTCSYHAFATDTNDTIQPQCWGGPIADDIYNTVLLTAPAQLVVSSGGKTTTNSLPAGLSHVETPFSPGQQSFTLQRNSQTVISLQGTNILSTIRNYDYFTASGYTYGQMRLSPPSNLKAKIY
jgi:glucan endo-1,3-alpha-glucosidase